MAIEIGNSRKLPSSRAKEIPGSDAQSMLNTEDGFEILLNSDPPQIIFKMTDGESEIVKVVDGNQAELVGICLIKYNFLLQMQEQQVIQLQEQQQKDSNND